MNLKESRLEHYTKPITGTGLLRALSTANSVYMYIYIHVTEKYNYAFLMFYLGSISRDHGDPLSKSEPALLDNRGEGGVGDSGGSTPPPKKKKFRLFFEK